jgi:hypothetical protein
MTGTECYLNTPKLNFNNRGILGEDICYRTTKDIQNISNMDYNLITYKDCECPSKKVEQMALNEPTILSKDGYGWTSVNGCNIDDDSNLRNASNLTNMRYIQQLYTRPYQGVPFMGRGVVDGGFENLIRTGEDTSQKKQCNTLCGIYIDTFVPLVPCLRDNIQNPIHLVEEVARKDWIRGGLPSRDLVRNTNYLQKCGLKHNKFGWVKPDNLPLNIPIKNECPAGVNLQRSDACIPPQKPLFKGDLFKNNYNSENLKLKQIINYNK